MNEISIIDKLKVVFELTKSNIFFPVIILLFIVISFLFVTTNKNNAKQSKKTYGALYIIALIVILIKYEASLSTMFDYMMDNLFVVFYFPNIAVYFGAIIVTNIIMWISMFSSKTKTSIKIINSIIFSVMHYLFILVLNIINTKNIDVFNTTALYKNNSIHSLIELSSNVFFLWILFLILYKIIFTFIENRRNHKIYNIDKLVVEHVGKKESTKNNIIQLPSYAKETTAPYIVKREMSKTKIVYELPKQSENTAVYEQMLTLDDYKLLISMLKEEKSKDVKELIEKKEIKHDIEKSIVNKENTKDKTDKACENRLSELMELYRSVS